MDIKKVIQDLESGTISTKATAEAFLDSYTPQEQKQIIAAMYIGRDYFHENQFKEGHLPSSSEVDHIPQTDYAEKRTSPNTLASLINVPKILNLT